MFRGPADSSDEIDEFDEVGESLRRSDSYNKRAHETGRGGTARPEVGPSETEGAGMDYLVIGAGPAGLRFGQFLHQAGRDYLILEAGATPGTSRRGFPHRPWHRPRPSGADGPMDPAEYVRYLTDFAVVHELKIKYHARVVRVARDSRGAREGRSRTGRGSLGARGAGAGAGADRDRRFVVTDQSGRVYRAKRVIVATGLGRPYLPPIPGIESAERHDDVEVAPADFAGQRVLILGTGDTAFATAARLAGQAAVVHIVGPRAGSATRIAHLTDVTGRPWAGNEIVLEPRRPAAQDGVLDATVRRIERRVGWPSEPGEAGERGERGEAGVPDEAGELVVTLSGARHSGSARMRMVQLRYDRVIACTGFQLDRAIFDASCSPEPALNGRLPALTSEWESVNVPDLFFAGELARVGPPTDHSGASVHGLRYCMRALWRMLDRKHEGTEWPYREVPADADSLTSAVLDRVNRSPGLFQRYAVLCDLVVVPPNATVARYYEEMPVHYVHDSLFGGGDRYFTVNLEYGDAAGPPDPLGGAPAAVRAGEPDEPDEADEDRYLRPVIRHYHRWALVAVQRLPEDVDHDWAGEEDYRAPLRSFFARQMTLTLA
jgi:thioredoxin reductase